MVTAAGSGYVRCCAHAVTRWAADRTRDADGYFLYLRDLESKDFWSAGFQPTLAEPSEYEASFYPGVVEIIRVDHGVRSQLEICCDPEFSVDIRRYTITNTSDRTRTIEITSYAEVVLQPAAMDAAHPAFSKLFLQTQFDKQSQSLVTGRRKRSSEDETFFACHFLTSSDGAGPDEYESDRCRFIGRRQSLVAPQALSSSEALSGTTGSVLDPIASLRKTFILPPNASACVTFFLGVSDSAEFQPLIAKYRDSSEIDAAFTTSRRIATEQLEQQGLHIPEYLEALRLGSTVLYGNCEGTPEAGRPKITTDLNGSLPANISPSTPLVVQNVESGGDLALASKLLGSAAYLEPYGLDMRVVLLNHSAFRDELENLIAESGLKDRETQIASLNSIDLSNEQLAWLQRRNVFRCSDAEVDVPRNEPEQNVSLYRVTDSQPEVCNGHIEKLKLANGQGGFSTDGTEYVIHVRPGEGKVPPLPWANVIANPSVGLIVTESGAGYTWVGNSRENRLTPWYNDPVTDVHSDAVLIRDENSGAYWSPTPGPCGDHGNYEVRHGFGYTTFSHTSHELQQETVKFVPPDAPLAITRVTLRNTSDHPRRISLFNYLTWDLGSGQPRHLQNVETKIDRERRTVFATSQLPGSFSGHVAFATLVINAVGDRVSLTADRTEFIGRNGHLASPQALLQGKSLSFREGSGLDPCAASQAYVDLAPGETLGFAVLVGQTETAEKAAELIDNYSCLEKIDQSLESAKDKWQRLVARVKVSTPVPELDVMVNGWLAYQNLSCRMWGRSAYYQAGGAFGFRDQLQDSSALLYHDPEITRRQILLHASHQFQEGDVLHWWHPPESCGIRTEFSDDLIWLPLIAAEYVEATGDTALWNEECRFLKSEPVPDGEPELFVRPEDSGELGTVYEHCCRALDRSLTTGEHGLPLIGCGDWNDGMNRVGQAGFGESVWLGFFLDCAITGILPVCEKFEDQERVAKYTQYRTDLRVALNDTGWDGQWYRRAYFDDGTPLGTVDAGECRIDALVQAWAILSGVAPRERAESALAAAEKFLIDEEVGMIRLLTPAFDRMACDPGYIKGYLPGVRENGGQYTHGVLWLIKAIAKMGRGSQATRLLAMLSPASRTNSAEKVTVFKTEPYAVAADVYGVPPHQGRGGWSWYTGSAGWMFRIAWESIFGITLKQGKSLAIDPRIDSQWTEFSIEYSLPGSKTRYEIHVLNPQGKESGVTSATLDGQTCPIEDGGALIPIVDDQQSHTVVVTL